MNGVHRARSLAAVIAGLVAAGMWAWALRRGLPLAAILYGSRGYSGVDHAEMVVTAAATALPLALLPLGIVATAVGVLWERRFALPVGLVTALAATVHLFSVWRTSALMYGF